MDKLSSGAQVDQRPAPQLLQHTLDSKLWIDQVDNEDDFYDNLGHSFDYQPDPIAERKIEAALFCDEKMPGQLIADPARNNAHLTRNQIQTGLTPVEEGCVQVAENSGHKLLRSQKTISSAEQGHVSAEYPAPDEKEDSVANTLYESELAYQKWNQKVSQCDENFGRLQQEIQAGLENFQKSIESLAETFSKMVPQMVEQLRIKAQSAIEEGEAKIQVGQNLKAMLVHAHKIARSFEESMNIER